ncbi:M15 family metallopeptidase [Methylopila sp. M107]|uniref:M15 family metallopeptidase n=1 Tax=Methylopila sp. M107 TaxID=1101190 RepID=UPI0003657831|nr:M15 family metallopeptidase [Methylopila sp. M107]
MIDNLSLQRALANERQYAGAVDGDVGPETEAAIANFVIAKLGAAGVRGWAKARLRVAAEQIILQKLAFYPAMSAIDGLVGPNTREAWERWQNAQRVSNVPAPVAALLTPTAKPSAAAAVKNNWPTQGGVPGFYGAVNTSQTQIALPFPMKLAWDKTKTVSRMTLHTKVAPSALRVLNRSKDHYGETGIRELGLDLFGGSLAVRKMRGGSSYSMHSWGIAIDFDPERNQLRWGRDRARLAKDDAVRFWQFWEEEGWVSLGRARNYDYMHVQAARL